MRPRSIAVSGAVLGLLAIVLGAATGHDLTSRLSAEALHAYDTGSRFFYVHAVALLALAAWAAAVPLGPVTRWVPGLWLTGTLLFSGGIYLSHLSAIPLGPAVPIGGGLLIVAWALLLLGLLLRR